MRISVKSRYALAAIVSMGQNFNTGEWTTVLSLSEKLDISKIYLEQVFSLLRRVGLVLSAKGAQGGYRLSASPDSISVLDVFSAIETSLFEKTEQTVRESAEHIEQALQNTVFAKLDEAITSTLRGVTIANLMSEAQQYAGNGDYMYYL